MPQIIQFLVFGPPNLYAFNIRSLRNVPNPLLDIFVDTNYLRGLEHSAFRWSKRNWVQFLKNNHQNMYLIRLACARHGFWSLQYDRCCYNSQRLSKIKLFSCFCSKFDSDRSSVAFEVLRYRLQKVSYLSNCPRTCILEHIHSYIYMYTHI